MTGWVCFFLAAVAVAGDNEPGTDGWIRLFDGVSLDGWRAGENAETFGVQDGKIVVQGERSHLYYDGPVEDHDFTNVELKVDVMTFARANSGVYFHTQYRQDGWPNRGFEVQINNSYIGSEGFRELKKTGSLYGIRNLFASGIPDEQWFTLHLVIEGRRVQIRINGLTVVDYFEPDSQGRRGRGKRLSSGTFALQGHDPGSKVFFKNIYVKPLPFAPRPPDTRSPDEIEHQGQISRWQAADIPLTDYHVHLKGGLTIDEALANARRTGITYGIAVNCGLGFAVTDDAAAEKFFQSLEGLPVFRAMQAEGREWMNMFSPATIARFDYVFTDAMTFHDRQGRRMRLWIPQEVHVGDPQEFMELLVETIERICGREPIDIYVNPTFLPAVIADQYDALWTEARMDRVIRAAVQNNVAIEINARYRLPSLAFIRRAKQAGVKFAFGTNNGDRNLGELEYCLEAVRACGLEKKDFFLPPTGRKKIAMRAP
ncbi:MAG: DUF1080 domain-containing protein [Sedimentisphaerales bacterium]|nr:DUF1080 domain-containing protein [Sedimentisphaerales bacterium]